MSNTATEKPPELAADDGITAPFGHFEPERAPFTQQAITASLRELGTKIGKDGWDLPSQLYGMAALSDGSIRTSDMRISPAAFNQFGAHPYLYLRHWAHTITQVWPGPPSSWCGWAFYAEQYTLTPERAAEVNSIPGEFERLAKLWQSHSTDQGPIDEPGQTELRSLYAVDADLRRYVWAERRDTGEVIEKSWTAQDALEWEQAHAGQDNVAISIFEDDCYESPLMDHVVQTSQMSARQRDVDTYRVPSHPPGWFCEVWPEWQEWHRPRP